MGEWLIQAVWPMRTTASALLDEECGRQTRAANGHTPLVLKSRPIEPPHRADDTTYYVYGQYAPQKAVILSDFDHYHVGLLAPSSRLNSFFVVQNKDLVCRPDFDAEVFAREFPALSQELARQVGGPKVRLANIPTRR
jgi:hypothetical protein